MWRLLLIISWFKAILKWLSCDHTHKHSTMTGNYNCYLQIVEQIGHWSCYQYLPRCVLAIFSTTYLYGSVWGGIQNGRSMFETLISLKESFFKKNWASFSLFFSTESIVNKKIAHDWIQPQISCVGSDHSTQWATITAQRKSVTTPIFSSLESRMVLEGEKMQWKKMWI